MKTVPFLFIFISVSLNVVHVRGKRGRQVSIYLMRSRKSALRGNDCMRKVIGVIPDLKFPKRIRSYES